MDSVILWVKLVLLSHWVLLSEGFSNIPEELINWLKLC